MVNKMNVESFNMDHTKVKAPFVRLADVKEGIHGDKIYKYDIRFCQPNQEHMEMPAIHSLEHLLAENIRNHIDHVFDLSPMGCQTGFYFSIINNDSYDEVLEAIEKTLNDVLNADEVPACNPVQCGWAASHDLEGAKALAKKMLAARSEWHQVYAE
ncbi:MAG: S-ribosylhomocysteine lyase [Tuberibacillus sp.]